MIATDGFFSLSMHKLAAAVDYTPGALYRYFPSKDALIAQITVNTLQELELRLRTRGNSVDENPLRSIVAIPDEYRRYSTEFPAQFGLLCVMTGMQQVLVSTPTQRRVTMSAVIQTLSPLAAHYAAAAECGAINPGDANSRALMHFGAVHGNLQLRKQVDALPGQVDVGQLASEVSSRILVGFGANPDIVAKMACEEFGRERIH